MLLNVRDLVVCYGSFNVLRNVSLSIEEGEVVAILGPNGAGKTTLIKTIISLQRVSNGMIEFNGERIDRLPSNEIIRKGISVCPEGGGCFPKMSVFDNLMMGAMMLKDRSVIEDVYDRVIGLFPILEKRKMQRAGSLSGGERQMLAIGRALMGTPKLVLMDEPSLGLAPLVINSIFDAIERLKNQGITIMLVEQNAQKALKVADRGYVMELGEIVISGTSKDIGENAHIMKVYLGM